MSLDLKIEARNSRNFLIRNGLNQKLAVKLSDNQAIEIAGLLIDNASKSGMMDTVKKIADMEVKNKPGVTVLVREGIATADQLRELSADQIKEVLDAYYEERDNSSVISLITDMLINVQTARFSIYDDKPYSVKRKKGVGLITSPTQRNFSY